MTDGDATAPPVIAGCRLDGGFGGSLLVRSRRHPDLCYVCVLLACAFVRPADAAGTMKRCVCGLGWSRAGEAEEARVCSDGGRRGGLGSISQAVVVSLLCRDTTAEFVSCRVSQPGLVSDMYLFFRRGPGMGVESGVLTHFPPRERYSSVRAHPPMATAVSTFRTMFSASVAVRW